MKNLYQKLVALSLVAMASVPAFATDPQEQFGVTAANFADLKTAMYAIGGLLVSVVLITVGWRKAKGMLKSA